jgi:hypothetical protein
MGQIKNARTILVLKTKNSLRRPRHRWENITEIDAKAIGIQLAQNKFQL